MTIERVPSANVIALWPKVGELLGRSLIWHPFLKTVDLLDILLSGFASLIVISEDDGIFGAVVMERVQYPSCAVANIVALAGDGIIKSGTEVEKFMEDWARSHGCRYLSGIGRPGWERMAPLYGGDRQRIVQVWKAIA